MNENGQTEAPNPAAKTAAAQIAIMQRLTQKAGGWLLRFKSVRTLADRTDAPRNEDGSYSADALVAWSRQEMPAVELADADLEGVLHLASNFASDAEGHVSGVVRILSGIKRKYGAPGMAAVAEIFLADVKSYQARFPSPYDRPKTPEEIQEECEKEAADRIAGLPTWDAHNDCRVLSQCERCKRYRWGRRWLVPPLPRGYVSLWAFCPEHDDEE
jgi:hypothetical protein